MTVLRKVTVFALADESVRCKLLRVQHAANTCLPINSGRRVRACVCVVCACVYVYAFVCVCVCSCAFMCDRV